MFGTFYRIVKHEQKGSLNHGSTGNMLEEIEHNPGMRNKGGSARLGRVFCVPICTSLVIFTWLNLYRIRNGERPSR